MDSTRPPLDQIKTFVAGTFLTASYPGNDPRAADRDSFPMLYGVCVRSRRQLEAFAFLAKRGYLGEGEFLLRAAIEHAVTAQWVYLTVGGYQQLRGSILRAQLTYIEQHIKVGDKGAQAALPGAQADVAKLSEADRLPNFTKKMLPLLDPLEVLSTIYRQLSQGGHVTSGTVEDFLTPGDDDSPVLSNMPKPHDEHALWHHAAACALLTEWVILHVTEDAANMTRLERWAGGLDLPVRLDWSLPDSERRFPDP